MLWYTGDNSCNQSIKLYVIIMLILNKNLQSIEIEFYGESDQ